MFYKHEKANSEKETQIHIKIKLLYYIIDVPIFF